MNVERVTQMNVRLKAAGSNAEARPSRQINVVIRPVETPAESAAQQEQARTAGQDKSAMPAEGPFADIRKELDRLVGLEHMKEIAFELYAILQMNRRRQEAGLTCQPHVYHMVFKGNPGTGKTTVARIMAKMFQQLGLLSKGHLLEVERADLVGEYIGHTAQKTRDLIKKAMGGVLFIDEAYSLARGGEKDFGKEAVDTLVKAMEDQKNQFVLILAGYSEEMDWLMQTNSGLPSRFPIQVEFPDYTVDQLLLIAESIAKEQDYVLMPQSLSQLKNVILDEKILSSNLFSNARFVRNVMEKAMRNQAVRLLQTYPEQSPGKLELMTLRPEDLKWERK
ncbi:ATPase AAA [Paenibacillus dendritiformis C454]|uniref:ATPase AAA n=2 Tax=Paenibacillus dendritiformis TaxID=130049 RepID=H3SBN9_9BACL|nr:ATPase AAA [Paenibacillus dendritiformis C454]